MQITLSWWSFLVRISSNIYEIYEEFVANDGLWESLKCNGKKWILTKMSIFGADRKKDEKAAFQQEDVSGEIEMFAGTYTVGRLRPRILLWKMYVAIATAHIITWNQRFICILPSCHQPICYANMHYDVT